MELSQDLCQALDSRGTPLKLTDPRTGVTYVLLPESDIQKGEQSADELSDFYRAQIETAWRAGWDDPAMDDYNDYDRKIAERDQ